MSTVQPTARNADGHDPRPESVPALSSLPLLSGQTDAHHQPATAAQHRPTARRLAGGLSGHIEPAAPAGRHAHLHPVPQPDPALGGAAPALSAGNVTTAAADEISRRGAQVQASPSGAGVRYRSQDVDWTLVGALRASVLALIVEASGQDAERLKTQPERARELIHRQIAVHNQRLTTAGQAMLTSAQQYTLAEATFDKIFRLGRIQPLVDDLDVEDIKIRGCDNVWLRRSDGQVERGPAVADTDQQLVEDLQWIAQHGGEEPRSFTPVAPHLDLQLRDGHRLSANAFGMSSRPNATIRIHRLVDVDLDDLVRLGMISTAMRHFLAAAVRAGRNIVVAGLPGAGKTTNLRALLSEVTPTDEIASVESERELHLDKMPHRHPLVMALQARPGTGERDASGRMVGEITLTDQVRHALRHGLQRLVVGEVRGDEIYPMFEAMQAGTGCMTTLHATSCEEAVDRLAFLARSADMPFHMAQRLVGQNIDLIVQLRYVDHSRYGGTRARFVSDVVALDVGGEDNVPVAFTHVFTAGPDGRGQPTGHQPRWLSDLVDHQFDPAWLTPDQASTWQDPTSFTRRLPNSDATGQEATS